MSEEEEEEKVYALSSFVLLVCFMQCFCDACFMFDSWVVRYSSSSPSLPPSFLVFSFLPPFPLSTTPKVSLKPFRLVEPRVRQLVNTVVPRSLVALQQHQENIAQLLGQKAWEKVNTEQINAARTAQVAYNIHIHVY